MGCCSSKSHIASSACQPQPPHLTPAPPPEEETVKEVLSEVPAPKPPISAIGDEKNWGPRSGIRKTQQDELRISVEKTSPLANAEEMSEASEICSLSETTLSAVPEKRDDDDFGEVRKMVGGSPARFRRERMAGKSPGRRPEPCPSPGRVRSSPAKEMRGAVVDGKRWDSGEVSGRRSRSPATRIAEAGAARAGLARSQSARKTGKSPGRMRSELSDKTRTAEESNRELTKWPPPTTNESLENPLVSLECFIFL